MRPANTPVEEERRMSEKENAGILFSDYAVHFLADFHRLFNRYNPKGTVARSAQFLYFRMTS